MLQKLTSNKLPTCYALAGGVVPSSTSVYNTMKNIFVEKNGIFHNITKLYSTSMYFKIETNKGIRKICKLCTRLPVKSKASQILEAI